MADLQSIADSLIKGKAQEVREQVEEAVKEGVSPADIMSKGLIAGMAVIGDRFKKNEVYVPEVLIAARAMHAGMDIIKPLLSDSGIKAKGVFAIGTVKGDLHDIGKNLVLMMMEGAGFDVIDLGIDVSPDKFVEAAKEGAQIIGMSALLTTTMPSMKTSIDAMNDAGVRESVKIMVGGAPLTQAYADQIGADGFAQDAATAVDVANTFV